MFRKLARHFFTLAAVVCVCVAAFMGWKLIKTQLDYRKGQEGLEAIYAQMDQAASSLESQIAQGAQADQQELEKRLRFQQYQTLHSQNQDMVGWIRIDGTVINYPVMHTPEDPEFYFHRDFEKKDSSYGMIFMDGDCRLDGTSPNLLLYGHHMRNGSMFAQIEDYDSQEFWQAHPLIQFDTLEEMGTYEVIGAFKAPAPELTDEFKQMLLAQTQEDYDQLMDFLKARHFYDTGLEAAYPQQLITLTTCEYTQKDGRFFLIARKTDSQPFDQTEESAESEDSTASTAGAVDSGNVDSGAGADSAGDSGAVQ